MSRLIPRLLPRLLSPQVLHTTRVVGVDYNPSPPYNPGQSFQIQVWVICDANHCDLRGCTVEIYDHRAALITTASIIYYDPYPYFTNRTDWLPMTAPSAEGRYTWKAVFPEQSGHSRSEMEFTFDVTAAPKTATSLTISASPAQVAVGGQTTISGKLTRTDTGQGVGLKDVDLYWKKPGQTSFEHWGRITTDSTGAYTTAPYDPYLEVEGTYEFYSEFPGDAAYTGCESTTVTATASAEGAPPEVPPCPFQRPILRMIWEWWWTR